VGELLKTALELNATNFELITLRAPSYRLSWLATPKVTLAQECQRDQERWLMQFIEVFAA